MARLMRDLIKSGVDVGRRQSRLRHLLLGDPVAGMWMDAMPVLLLRHTAPRGIQYTQGHPADYKPKAAAAHLRGWA
jgi:hypothetical protein